MSDRDVYAHPSPRWYRWTQCFNALLLGVMMLAMVLQVVLAVLTRGGIFWLTAVMMGLLGLPIVMALSASPPVRLEQEGIRIMPYLWREQLITWENISAIKPYTLLPTPNHEVERRALQGRKRYVAAQGVMLVVPSLGWQYRVAGYFAGEGGKPIIALTNRTHARYDDLLKRVQAHLR
jgi:hypothetical protein